MSEINTPELLGILGGGGGIVGLSAGYWIKKWMSDVEDGLREVMALVQKIDKNQGIMQVRLEDSQNTRERLIKLEPAVKQAHRRLDKMNGYTVVSDG